MHAWCALCPGNYKMAQVKCQRCGDSSHVTADCPMKDKPINKEMDKEYLSFMAELGEPGAKDGASFCAVLCCVVWPCCPSFHCLA